MGTIRILHILHSMNRGGAENAIMNYYREIDRNLVQFDFLLTDQCKCLFDDEIKSLGGKIYRIRPLSLSNPLPYLIDVYRFLKDHREYQIVHSHSSSKSVFPLGIAKLLNIPIRISHSHNSKSEPGFKGIIRNLLMPFLKVTANVYMSCGEQAANWLYGKKFLRTGKVKIIRNVISCDKFRLDLDKRAKIRSALGILEDCIVVGHVARFSEQKNHKFGLEIFNELVKIKPNAVYVMIGDGALRDEITSYANYLGIAQSVKMIGVVDNVYDYEQAFDVFILPSLFEGLPLSIVEAQVSGLPCFTTKGTVSEECSVTNLVHYLPLGNAKLWADEILKGIREPRKDRTEEVKEAGYDNTTSAKALQDIYISLYTSFGE